MARLNRFVVAGEAHHLVHRTVAGTDAFPGPTDLPLFIDALRRSSREHGVLIHAYVLLPHEIQLMATPPADDSLSRMMQALARFYVPSYNRRHDRAGALWQGRFRAAPVGGAQALLTCMRYIEQAPQRAGWSGQAAEFSHSSASHHVGNGVDLTVAPAPNASGYWKLGNTPFEREAAYRNLLDHPLAAAQLQAVESSTLKGWAMGSGEFLASLAASALAGARRPATKARGRPRKAATSAQSKNDVSPI